MRLRPSARILLLDENEHVLLFRFAFTRGVLAGQNYWATPGGAVEEGETMADAARRELFEETGIAVENVGEPVGQREFVLQLTSDENVLAQETFFLVRVPRQALRQENWEAHEKEVMVEHRWWSRQELQATKEVVYPENLAAWW